MLPQQVGLYKYLETMNSIPNVSNTDLVVWFTALFLHFKISHSTPRKKQKSII